MRTIQASSTAQEYMPEVSQDALKKSERCARVAQRLTVRPG